MAVRLHVAAHVLGLVVSGCLPHVVTHTSLFPCYSSCKLMMMQTTGSECCTLMRRHMGICGAILNRRAPYHPIPSHDSEALAPLRCRLHRLHAPRAKAYYGARRQAQSLEFQRSLLPHSCVVSNIHDMSVQCVHLYSLRCKQHHASSPITLIPGVSVAALPAQNPRRGNALPPRLSCKARETAKGGACVPWLKAWVPRWQGAAEDHPLGRGVALGACRWCPCPPIVGPIRGYEASAPATLWGCASELTASNTQGVHWSLCGNKNLYASLARSPRQRCALEL